MPSEGENAPYLATLCSLCKEGNKADVQKMLDEKNAPQLSDLFKGECLYATVIGGNSGLLKCLLSRWYLLREHIADQQDGYGNTAIHLAVRRNRVDLVKQLVDFQPKLCNSRNKGNETPLFLAVRLGVGEMVKALVKAAPESVLELCGNKDILDGHKNVLHLAAELHLVHIARLLTKLEGDILKKIINHGAGFPLNQPPAESTLQAVPDSSLCRKKKGEATILGDTPLHIAARRKCLQMVDILLAVDGVDKYAMNHHGFTPLDITKEKTEYYERYKIIAKLSDYPSGHRPFMYNAPSPSPIKLAKANNIVDKDYHNRQNAEIVVAALLATMTFSAVFQVPGGFHSDTEKKDGIVLGAPTLIGYESFKLFLIFDCVAFFLSLFVVFMWQMSSELTTGDKMLFMCINNLLVCLSFGFTASGFIAAVYAVLAHKVKLFSLVVLASMASILIIGCIASWYKAATFSVTRARFNQLCGVPCWLDNVVEVAWLTLERCHILDLLRKFHECVKKYFIFGLCDNGCSQRLERCHKSDVRKWHEWVKHFIVRLCGNERREREATRTREGELCSPFPLFKGSQSSV